MPLLPLAALWIPSHRLGALGVAVSTFRERRLGAFRLFHLVQQPAAIVRGPRATGALPHRMLFKGANRLHKPRIIFVSTGSFPGVLPDKRRGDANTSINT